MARVRTDFGKRLLEARERKGLSQPKAAAAIGISQGTLSDLENRAQGSQHTPALAQLYGVDPYYLATGEMTPPAKPANPSALATKLQVQMPPGAQNPYTQALPWARLGDYMRPSRREDAREDTPPYMASRWFVVDTDEMSPSIQPGDEVLADPVAPLKPGAIILCQDTHGGWHLRRVQDIGGGDWIAAADNAGAYGPLKQEALAYYCRVCKVSKMI